MTDGFVIDRNLHRNPKFLACGGLARQIYCAMILECDDEGRELADPLTWMRHAALFGPAAATVDQVRAALDEMDQVRLAPRYEVVGKAYVFLPGRFEHNGARKYWKRSHHPLPPDSMLAEFPEYARGLALLTTKSELRHSMRGGEARRYPQVAHLIPEFGGQPMGNQWASDGQDMGMTRESPVEVEVDVEEEGDSSSSVHEPTRAAAGGAAPESPPVVADALPEETQRPKLATRAQQQFAARLLASHRLTVAGWLEAAGHDELLDSHVDEIRSRYGGRQPPPATGPRAHLLPQAPDPDLSDEDRAASAAALARVKRSTGNTKSAGVAAN
jgi:hypothetical protein